LVTNHNKSEVVQIASVFVVQSHAESYLKRLLGSVIPAYEAASGLLTVAVLRRSLVGYEEFATVTTWQSEEHMQNFCESNPAISQSGTSIQREPPQLYQVVFNALCAQEGD
jgi:heme-degrading monooxygenase HmoA